MAATHSDIFHVTISVASADLLGLHTFEGHADVACQNIWHVVAAIEFREVFYNSIPPDMQFCVSRKACVKVV